MTRIESRKEFLIPLTTDEADTVAGGMINQYPDGGNPKSQGQQRGALVSMIGYRTFADVGL